MASNRRCSTVACSLLADCHFFFSYLFTFPGFQVGIDICRVSFSSYHCGKDVISTAVRPAFQFFFLRRPFLCRHMADKHIRHLLGQTALTPTKLLFACTIGSKRVCPFPSFCACHQIENSTACMPGGLSVSSIWFAHQ